MANHEMLLFPLDWRGRGLNFKYFFLFVLAEIAWWVQIFQHILEQPVF